MSLPLQPPLYSVLQYNSSTVSYTHCLQFLTCQSLIASLTHANEPFISIPRRQLLSVTTGFHLAQRKSHFPDLILLNLSAFHLVINSSFWNIPYLASQTLSSSGIATVLQPRHLHRFQNHGSTCLISIATWIFKRHLGSRTPAPHLFSSHSPSHSI